MQVWVYPEKQWEDMGAVRWEVEWYVLTPGAQKRYDADPNYEHDHDRDEQCVCRTFKTEKAAKAFARKLLKTTDTVYGCCTITKQTVDWYVEEDRIAEWTNVGEPEYLP